MRHYRHSSESARKPEQVDSNSFLHSAMQHSDKPLLWDLHEDEAICGPQSCSKQQRWPSVAWVLLETSSMTFQPRSGGGFQVSICCCMLASTQPASGVNLAHDPKMPASATSNQGDGVGTFAYSERDVFGRISAVANLPPSMLTL